MAAFVVTLDGVIAGWGDGVATLLGYRADEVIGRDVSMFLPGEHPSHFPRILAAAARGPGSRREHGFVRDIVNSASVGLCANSVRNRVREPTLVRC